MGCEQEPDPAVTSTRDFVCRYTGRLLQTRRLALGLHQETVATAAGFSDTRLSALELGQRFVSVERLLRLAAILGIPRQHLFPPETPPPLQDELMLLVQRSPTWEAALTRLTATSEDLTPLAELVLLLVQRPRVWTETLLRLLQIDAPNALPALQASPPET